MLCLPLPILTSNLPTYRSTYLSTYMYPLTDLFRLFFDFLGLVRCYYWY